MKRPIFPMLLSFALTVVVRSPLLAQTGTTSLPWLGPSSTRSVLDLSGEWQVVRSVGVQTAGKVRLPFYVECEGELVLEREIDLDSTLTGKQAWLVAYGISRECEVWLNDRFLGSHVGEGLSFAIRLDPSVIRIPGRNLLRLRVRGGYEAWSTLPLRHRPFGWYGGTGVPLPIYLLFVPSVAIRDVRVEANWDPARGGTLRWLAEVMRRNDAPASSLSWQVVLLDASTHHPVATRAKQVIHFGDELRTKIWGRFDPLPVQAWSPKSPRLYLLRLSLLDSGGKILDVVENRVGFRSLVGRNGRLYLNGAPFVCKGTELVAEGRLPTGQNRVQWAVRVVQQIKGVGCNTVRVIGHPPDPAFLEAADSLGLLVLEEIPLWKVPTPILRRSLLEEQASDYVAEMVARDRNHPAVGAWGLGVNLDYWRPEVQRVLGTLRDRLAELDARASYVVASPLEVRKTDGAWPVDWVLLDATDRAQPFNISNLEKQRVVLPITGFLPYRPIGADTPSEVVEQNRSLRLLRAGRRWLSTPGNSGLLVRSWRDWRGPSPVLWLGPPPTEWLPYGLLRPDGTRRLQYSVVRSLFAGDEAPKMRYISFAPERTSVFTLVSLLAIAVFLWYFRRDRRFRGNIRRIFVYPSSIYEDVRSNRKIFAYHTFLQGLFAALSFAVFASSVLFYLKRSLLFDELSTLFVGDLTGKVALVWLAWHPFGALLVLTSVGLLLFILVAWFIWVLGLVSGYFIPLGQCITFVFWIATAFLPAILWGTVAYRLMIVSRGFLWLTLAFWGLLSLWFLVRLVRGTAIVFRRSVFPSAVIVLGFVFAVFAALFVYLHHEHALGAYLGYYLARILARR